MVIRLAEHKDIHELIKMRWDFTIEYDESKKDSSYEDFEKECYVFLEKALNGDTWFIWVAEENGTVVSHIYIELIQKVPRPGKVTNSFAYMTNVYTIPEYRNMGIGSKVLGTINKWIKDNSYEFVIVWPSEDSINYYKKNGYIHSTEPMEYFPS
ncbi:GNAT superfamily N-acetyltransferase [Bacillus mesophilus]|uniref:GNAT family N-acetyltransferase n=1 Tax=Bacillus mesophilus TaxID=1808955 RepID=A0A6M0QAQ4_9BACI|nr:GNAT family N-acetyltransferase [Bacillus mesophilus]MBM7662559.1 GNAT superfamily N-acetyltransferase [Bacillus mesophilus]NEY73373.1 GNAT family N-acetyltransferase [Bacillus mesophilus]